MLSQFLTFVKGVPKGSKFLLANSGGVDSMVLFDLLLKNKINFEVAHCNFNLREMDSLEDQNFVKSVCEKHQILFHTKKFKTKKYAIENGLSIQMAARELRYKWFKKLVKNQNYFLLTAHHLNDSIETQLFNLIKGTGPKGLKGIDFEKGNLIRPLINSSKDEIINYAITNKISWREDSSNIKNDYSRNKIRNKIIPLIKEINPGFDLTSKRNLKRMHFLNSFLDLHYNSLKSIYFKDEKYFNLQEIKNDAFGFLFLERLLSSYGFTFDQIESIYILDVHQNESKTFKSKNHLLEVKSGIGLLNKIQTENKFEPFEIAKSNSNYNTIYGELQVEIIDEFPSLPMLRNSEFVYLDIEKLEEPLLIRKRIKGDRFTPFGMVEGSKLISDFMIEKKYTSQQKKEQLILTSNGKIAALIGKRIDMNFSLNSGSKKILKIHLKELKN